jgi:hypothetical protein
MSVDSFNLWGIRKIHQHARVVPLTKTEDRDPEFKRFQYDGENEENIIDVEYTEVETIPERLVLRVYNAFGDAVSHVLPESKINIKA